MEGGGGGREKRLEIKGILKWLEGGGLSFLLKSKRSSFLGSARCLCRRVCCEQRSFNLLLEG